MIRLSMFCILALGSFSVHAQEDPEGIAITASVDAKYDDNATRVPRGGAGSKVDEMQYTYTAGVDAGYKTYMSQTNAAYSVIKQEYAEDSRVNDTYFVGGANVHLGSETSRIYLDASHNSRQALINSTDEAELANTRNEETVTLAPTLRTRPDRRTVASLSGVYTKTDSDREDISNSESNGAYLSVSRRITRLDNLGLIAQLKEVKFDGDESLDYEQTNLGAQFNSSSRNGKLDLELGYSRVNSQALETEKDFYYAFNYQLSKIGSDFSLASSRYYSDTSNNEGLDFGGGVSASAVQGIQGQIVVDSASLAWKTSVFCQACNFSATYGMQSVQYIEFEEISSESKYIDIRFSKKLTPRIAINAGIVQRNVDSETSLEKRTNKDQSYTVGVNASFFKALNTSLYVALRDRENADVTSDQNIIGLTLNYTLNPLQ